MTAMPSSDSDSMCSMSATPVVKARSERVTMRPSISRAGRPLYDHTIETIGMFVDGKMSVGIETAANAPNNIMRTARHAVVYGRRSANRTIHMYAFFYATLLDSVAETLP